MNEKTDVTSRAGKFTSSKIFKLMTNSKTKGGIGQPGLTYIEEKKLEKKLGRQLEIERTSRSASWGRFVQHRVTNVLLDSGCKPTKDIRRDHPTLGEYWSGAEDYLREFSVGEVKCFELKNFCKVHDAATMGYDFLKEECPEVFWQLVSNCILNLKDSAELSLYIPYESELSAIREEADQSDTPYEYQWIKYASNDELPYLIEGQHYQNLTKFPFVIREEDMKALTSRVELAIKLMKP